MPQSCHRTRTSLRLKDAYLWCNLFSHAVLVVLVAIKKIMQMMGQKILNLNTQDQFVFLLKLCATVLQLFIVNLSHRSKVMTYI